MQVFLDEEGVRRDARHGGTETGGTGHARDRGFQGLDGAPDPDVLEFYPAPKMQAWGILAGRGSGRRGCVYRLSSSLSSGGPGQGPTIFGRRIPQTAHFPPASSVATSL